MTDTPTVHKVTRHAGIAGQFSISAEVEYPGESRETVTFVGSTYGGRVVMVLPNGLQTFVDRSVMDRCGSELTPEVGPSVLWGSVMTYGRKSWAIVGYTFQAQTRCPTCTIAALPTGEGQAFDGWALAEGVHMTPEENLTELAHAFGIDRDNESSFDSDEFPKVVFDSSLQDGERCDRCGEEL